MSNRIYCMPHQMSIRPLLHLHLSHHSLITQNRWQPWKTTTVSITPSNRIILYSTCRSTTCTLASSFVDSSPCKCLMPPVNMLIMQSRVCIMSTVSIGHCLHLMQIVNNCIIMSTLSLYQYIKDKYTAYYGLSTAAISSHQ